MTVELGAESCLALDRVKFWASSLRACPRDLKRTGIIIRVPLVGYYLAWQVGIITFPSGVGQTTTGQRLM